MTFDNSFESHRRPSLDSVRVELRLEEVDLHGREQVALPERVRHGVLLAGMDFGYHEDVVEEEYLALVNALKEGTRKIFFRNLLHKSKNGIHQSVTWSLFLIGVGDLVQPTVADQPPVWDGQVGALGDDRLLHLRDLSHVVRP